MDNTSFQTPLAAQITQWELRTVVRIVLYILCCLKVGEREKGGVLADALPNLRVRPPSFPYAESQKAYLQARRRKLACVLIFCCPSTITIHPSFPVQRCLNKTSSRTTLSPTLPRRLFPMKLVNINLNSELSNILLPLQPLTIRLNQFVQRCGRLFSLPVNHNTDLHPSTCSFVEQTIKLPMNARGDPKNALGVPVSTKAVKLYFERRSLS